MAYNFQFRNIDDGIEISFDINMHRYEIGVFPNREYTRHAFDTDRPLGHFTWEMMGDILTMIPSCPMTSQTPTSRLVLLNRLGILRECINSRASIV